MELKYYSIKVQDVLDTIEGNKARVVATDARIDGGEYDILVLIRMEDGTDFVEWYKSKDIDWEMGTLPCVSSSGRDLLLNPIT